MTNPKNVEAVRAWLLANTGAENAAVFDRLLAMEANNDALATSFVGLTLQGFEAGRQFEREHPDVESGVGLHQRLGT